MNENMKKKYLVPDTNVIWITMEMNFLTSTRSANSSNDLTIDDVVDNGSFWDYE